MVFGIGEGKIDIILEKNNFKPGDTIRGKVQLQLNSPKKARELRIVLIAEMEQSKGDKRELYRAPIILDREKEYSSGTYDFEIVLPNLQSVTTLPTVTGVAKDILDVAMFFAGGPRVVRWYLSAELDLPMALNITKKMQLNVV